MNGFHKQKTTANQLFQVFLDDFLNDISDKSYHPKYTRNKIKEYNYLKTM
jgi:hypothetical protein